MIQDLWELIKVKFLPTRKRVTEQKIYIYEDAYDILVEKNPLVKRLRDMFDCEIC